MLSVFTYQVLRLLREKVLLVWTLGFPIILSLIFMAMFSNLDDDYKADAVALGVVQDDAYRAAPGLDETISSISADGSDLHLIDATSYATEDEAVSAAQRGDTAGYIDVEDGAPVLHVTQEWNTASGSQANTILVLRAVMDSYVQTGAEHAALACRLSFYAAHRVVLHRKDRRPAFTALATVFVGVYFGVGRIDTVKDFANFLNVA